MFARRKRTPSFDHEASRQHHPFPVPSLLLFDYSDLHFVCGFDSETRGWRGEMRNFRRATVEGSHIKVVNIFQTRRKVINYYDSKYSFHNKKCNENIFSPFPLFRTLFFVSKRCLVDFLCSFFVNRSRGFVFLFFNRSFSFKKKFKGH